MHAGVGERSMYGLATLSTKLGIPNTPPICMFSTVSILWKTRSDGSAGDGEYGMTLFRAGEKTAFVNLPCLPIIIYKPTIRDVIHNLGHLGWTLTRRRSNDYPRISGRALSPKVQDASRVSRSEMDNTAQHSAFPPCPQHQQTKIHSVLRNLVCLVPIPYTSTSTQENPLPTARLHLSGQQP